jgi:chromosome partitioning protein
VAADAVVVPLQLHYKAYLGTDKLLGTIKNIRKAFRKPLPILGFVPMQTQDHTHDRQVLEALQSQTGDDAPILEAVPMSTAFKQASVQGMTLGQFDPSHRALAALRNITSAIVARLEALQQDGQPLGRQLVGGKP